MYWAPADVKSNLPHMAEPMRKFVKSSGCRRKFLTDYFGGPKPDVDPDPGRCCDVCNPEEQNDTEAQETKYPTCNKKVAKVINCFLTQYCDMENAKIGSPYPASISLLTPSLAKEISKAYTCFINVDNIREKYPNLADDHCKNIATIISSYVASLN